MTAPASIHEIVRGIRRQPGVEAVVVLGRDGLVIDSESSGSLNPDEIAAKVRSLVDAADDLMPFDTATGERGDPRLITGIMEYAGRYGIVSVLSADAILCILAEQDALGGLGPLVHQIRRHRESIAALV